MPTLRPEVNFPLINGLDRCAIRIGIRAISCIPMVRVNSMSAVIMLTLVLQSQLLLMLMLMLILMLLLIAVKAVASLGAN